MTIARGYSAVKKFWDQMGRVTGAVEHSESDRPNIERMVAPWLPVSRYEEEYHEWIVISSGKVVAESREGHLVPAGLKKAFNVATGSTALTYTADDVTNLTMDLTTGVAVTTAKTVTETTLTTALRERGLIGHTERAYDFISNPVGFASYNYYQAASYTDNFNPATLRHHNFRLQANCAITCDYVGRFPVLPALATTEATADRTGGATGLMEDIFDGTSARDASHVGFFTSTQIAEVTRYASDVTAGDDIVAFMTLNYPVAVDTADTAISTSTSSCLVREVESISAIRAAGDYYWDYELGVLFLYEAGGDAVPSPWVAATTTITYYHYSTEGSATNTPSTYACATGPLNFGDFVTYDKYSNIVKASLDIGTAPGYSSASAGTLYSVDPEYDDQTDNTIISAQIEKAVVGYVEGIIGQVVGVQEFGQGRYSNDYLDRVRTVHLGETAANMRLPGTATEGRTDLLTYAKGSERIVLVNLIMR